MPSCPHQDETVDETGKCISCRCDDMGAALSRTFGDALHEFIDLGEQCLEIGLHKFEAPKPIDELPRMLNLKAWPPCPVCGRSADCGHTPDEMEAALDAKYGERA